MRKINIRCQCGTRFQREAEGLPAGVLDAQAPLWVAEGYIVHDCDACKDKANKVPESKEMTI